MKSVTISALLLALAMERAPDLEEEEEEDEEILVQRSLKVEGVWAEAESETVGSMDLLKHQFLPLIGNTTNLALIVPKFQWRKCSFARSYVQELLSLSSSISHINPKSPKQIGFYELEVDKILREVRNEGIESLNSCCCCGKCKNAGWRKIPPHTFTFVMNENFFSHPNSFS